MQTAKQAAQAMIASVPDDATYEEIQYRLGVLERIAIGLAEVDRGDVIPHEEVVKRMAKWLD
jgi:predicted transcriptional regulator